MNVVEKCVVTLKFSKDNLRNFLALVVQQPCGEPNKVAPPKTKGAKRELGGASLSYSISHVSYCKCSWKVYPLSFFHPHFHPQIPFIHYTWHNILPHHQIFCPKCDKYVLNIMSTWEEYSKKDSIMLSYSHSCLQAHEITSLLNRPIFLDKKYIEFVWWKWFQYGNTNLSLIF